jgi:phage gp29-like protein
MADQKPISVNNPYGNAAPTNYQIQQDVVENVKENLEAVLGDSGTKRYNGFFLEEANEKWRDAARVETVEDMRRGDGAVRAVLSAIKAPILSAEWNIWTEDSSPKGQEIRGFVEANVFHMERDFKEFLRESLTYIDFGHSAWELIWEIRDGRICLKDLAPRIQSSILYWEMFTTKQPGITQILRTNNISAGNNMREIPMDKLFVLTNEKEGDDITGQSILRAAYIHWKHKRTLYLIAGIAADRYGVGVPTLYLPEMGYDDAEKNSAVEMLKNLRSNEQSYMVMPNGFKAEILTPNGNGVGEGLNTMIEHHNRMICMTVLAQFLNLGTEGVGSLALSNDQSSFFLKHVEGIIHYFRSQFNTQIIRKLVDLNYGKQATYPELRNSTISEKNLLEFSQMIKNFIDAGVITTDTDLQQWIRQTVKAPEMTDEQMAEEEAKETPVQKVEEEETEIEVGGNEEMNEHTSHTILSAQTLQIGRKLTAQEKRVNFQQLNEQFNDIQTQFEQDMSDLTAAEIDRYSQAVQKNLASGNIAAISAMSFGILGKVKTALAAAMLAAYQKGKTGAASEMGVDRPTTPLVMTQVMNMDTEDLANAYVDNFNQKSRDITKNALINGASAVAVAAAVKEIAKKDADKTISNLSGTIVDKYINRGRSTVFQSNINKIVGFQRSEVLDNRTCPTCESMDEKTIKAHDPMANMDQVHSDCRGIWVPIMEGDDPQEITGFPKAVTNSFDLIDGRPTVNAFTQLKKPVK